MNYLIAQTEGRKVWLTTVLGKTYHVTVDRVMGDGGLYVTYSNGLRGYTPMSAVVSIEWGEAHGEAETKTEAA